MRKIITGIFHVNCTIIFFNIFIVYYFLFKQSISNAQVMVFEIELLFVS
jgi:hypothetical protein